MALVKKITISRDEKGQDPLGLATPGYRRSGTCTGFSVATLYSVSRSTGWRPAARISRSMSRSSCSPACGRRPCGRSSLPARCRRGRRRRTRARVCATSTPVAIQNALTCGMLSHHQPRDGVHAQRVERRRRRQLPHLVVVRMKRERDEGLKARPSRPAAPARAACGRRAPPSSRCGRRASSRSCAGRGDAAVRWIDEVPIGVGLVVRDLPPHPLGENLGAAARQRVEPRRPSARAARPRRSCRTCPQRTRSRRP